MYEIEVKYVTDSGALRVTRTKRLEVDDKFLVCSEESTVTTIILVDRVQSIAWVQADEIHNS